MLITVYWEDQRGAQPKAFGPLALLLACLADETGRDRWHLRDTVVAVPNKGVSKLKAALQHDALRSRDAGPVVVVFDNDRVRGFLDLSKNACKSEVIAQIQALCPVQPAIVLLEDNVEDLLNACLRAAGKLELHVKPNPNERDTIFHFAADADRATRDPVRAAVPSFDRLVRYVQRCLVSHRVRAGASASTSRTPLLIAGWKGRP